MLGVHVKDDEMVGCSQMEVELEFLGDPKDLDRTGQRNSVLVATRQAVWKPDCSDCGYPMSTLYSLQREVC